MAISKRKQQNLFGKLCLLIATMLWGTSFVILKDTIDELPPFYVVSIRFIIASFILALFSIKKLKNISKPIIIHGIILGSLIASAYVFQTEGLVLSTPSRNAFMTSTYCVMCPIVYAIYQRRRVKIISVVCAVLCMVGIGFVVLSGRQESNASMLIGDGLTLIGAVFFAFQIIYIDKFNKEKDDATSVLLIELFSCGVILGIISLCFEFTTKNITAFSLSFEQIWKILYLSVFCTLIAQFLQIIGQKYTSPSQASILLTLECVFAVIFSLITGREKMTLLLAIGFVIIFIALTLSETNKYVRDKIKLYKEKKRLNEQKEKTE